ncbi:MAG: hypothetical protein Q9221_000553 [Calogaya cf. arnoldii]
MHGPSNGSGDNFLEGAEKDDPQLGSLRYSSYDNEIRAMRKLEYVFDDEESEVTDPVETNEKTRAQHVQDAEERQAFLEFFDQCSTNDSEWKETSSKRPHWNTLSLHSLHLVCLLSGSILHQARHTQQQQTVTIHHQVATRTETPRFPCGKVSASSKGQREKAMNMWIADDDKAYAEAQATRAWQALGEKDAEEKRMGKADTEGGKKQNAAQGTAVKIQKVDELRTMKKPKLTEAMESQS